MTGPFEDPAFLAAEAYWLTPDYDRGEVPETDAEERYDMREDELREKHLGLWDDWDQDRAVDAWELRKELGEHEERFWDAA